MSQKKIMLLGGLRYLLPAIKAAHEQGYYVITADYLPGNIAHRYSDEYVNVSIVDKEAVLTAARERMIDGIMSFACDPGVISAAYVQEKMGLPSFGPFKSVEILQNKDRFRAFLAENGFNVPKASSYDNRQDALNDADKFDYPVIVKPTDSAGSKGVSRVDDRLELASAIDNAFKFSLSGHIIIEDFIETRGCSSDSDSFSVDGQLRFVSFSSQRFDSDATNPYTPAAYSWPSTFSEQEETFLTSELQRLITLLGMKTALFNIETRVAVDGKPYIMEVTPRAGGNRLAEMIHYATGVDLISAIVRTAVGDPIDEMEQKPYDGFWAEIILHSDKSGIFQGLQIDGNIPAKVFEVDLWVKPGYYVDSFEAANNTIGTFVFRCDNHKDLVKLIATPNEWLKVRVK